MNPKKAKPTSAQLAVLRNLASGRPTSWHCRTQSDHGGLVSTLVSMRRRGWVQGSEITDAGRAVLAAA